MGSRLLTLAVATLASIAVSSAWAASATRISSFEYHATSGLLTKETIEPDHPERCLVTTYVQDAYGNNRSATTSSCAGASGTTAIVSRTSNTHFESSVTIDGVSYPHTAGRFPVRALNALGHEEKKAFDARFGAVVKLNGPNNLTTTWAYDNFGRKTLETRADGTRTEWAYIWCSGVNGGTHACPTNGQYLVRVTPQDASGAANGAIGKTYYDALNREIRSETGGFDGILVFKDTQYDDRGRVSRVSRPYQSGGTALWTVLTYDVLGRVLTVVEPTTVAGTIKTETVYNGFVTAVTVSNNGLGSGLPEGVTQSKTTTRNSQGQVVEVKDTQNNTVTYAYDPFGNLLTTNAGGVITTLTYDIRGRKTSMTDADMGYWTYRYNALGELVWQCDPRSRAAGSTGSPADCTSGTTGTATQMSYDLLGRMTQRQERDLVSRWFYDAYPTGAAEWESSLTGGLANNCAKGVGKPCYVSASNNYRRLYTYDTAGRVSEVVTKIDVAYKLVYGYDANGRVSQTTYPQGFVAKNVYNARGYLEKVTNGAGTLEYWKAASVSASGKVLTETLGNGLTTTRGYDVLDRLLTSTVGSGGNTIRQYEYNYDTLGNVTQRKDIVPNNITENFTYDRLNRLTKVENGTPAQDRIFTYTAIGNIAKKSDVTGAVTGTGQYTYPAITGTRPHAVSSVSGGGAASTITATYGYDANGNLASASGTLYPTSGSSVTFSRTLAYMSFDMPASISHTQGGNNYGYSYTYNADHERVKLVTTNLAGTFTTVYLHPAGRGQLLYERETKAGSTQVEHKNFIQAGAVLIGVYITRENPQGGNPATEMRYFHHDHLGSVVAISSASGVALERLSFEAFGERRKLDGSPQNRVSPEIGNHTDRGFTSHEHLDEMNLIHMNGRVYDPALGRFMTADPTLQAPANLQGYNRYSYTLNNPLGYVDPSGYSWKKWRKAVIAIVVSVVTYGVATELMAAYTASASVGGASAFGVSTVTAANTLGFSISTVGTMTAGAAAGFAGGIVSGGNLESGLYGAVGGGLGGALAGSGLLGQMVGGGINGYLQTGNLKGFGRGFAVGAIPNDLGFTSAYRDSPGANIGIGIARDGIRGGIIAGSRDGIIRGIQIGQATNAVGHLVGLTTATYTGIKNGAFTYRSDTWPNGAITFGNVITGNTNFLENALNVLHERDHIFNPVERALGALYIPVHAIELGTGHIGRALGFGCRGFFIEEGVQRYPYSSVAPALCQ